MATSLGSTELISPPENEQLMSKSFDNVQETEVKAPHASHSPAERSRIEAIGPANLAIIVGSLLFTIIITWFIIFLWHFSPTLGFAGTEPTFWRTIVLRQWVQLSLTITAAILRAVIGLQLGVTLCIIAGLMLEQSTVSVRFAPLVITLRGSGTASTWAMLEYLFSRQTLGANPLLSGAALIVLGTSLLSQLSSTFLISDLGMGQVLENSQTHMLAYSMTPEPDLRALAGYQEITDEVGYWTSIGTEYPVFAEYSIPPIAREDWKYDTGLALRSYPPFRTAQQRSSVSQYTGHTIVQDSRVTCAFPSTTNVSMEVYDYSSTINNHTMARLNGSLSVQLPFHIKQFNNSIGSIRIPFNCSVSLRAETYESHADVDWAVTVCNPIPASGGLYMDSPLSTGHWDGLETLANTWIVINTTGTGTGNEWRQQAMHDNTFFQLKVSNSTKPWTKLSHPKHDDISLDMSVCFNMLDPITIPVSMKDGRPGRTEPTAAWDAAKRQFNISDIVNLHAGAALGLGQRDRGTLTLEKRSNWTANWTADWDFARRFTLSAISLRNFQIPMYYRKEEDIAMTMCTYCETGRFVFRAQRLHVLVFQDVLKATGSLPLAIQALWSILLQRAWYDSLPQFDKESEATYTMYTERQVPVRRTGMIVVLVVVLAHNAVVLFVAGLFLLGKRRQLSMLGNIWQGFGQLAVGDVAELAARTTMALDKEVMRELKEDELREEVVQLVHDSDEGVLRLMRRRRKRRGSDSS